MSALQELLDKQALYELVVRYCRAVDRADAELLRSVYHEDAIDEHGAFVGTREELVDFLGASTMDVERRPSPLQHAISNALFEIDGDVAYGETYVEVRRVEGGVRYIEGHGRYVDRFERRDGEWRIAHRIAIAEYVAAEDGRSAYDPETFVRGSRDRRDPSYARP
jgi:ketosteroid isomerase-like protein